MGGGIEAGGGMGSFGLSGIEASGGMGSFGLGGIEASGGMGSFGLGGIEASGGMGSFGLGGIEASGGTGYGGVDPGYGYSYGGGYRGVGFGALGIPAQMPAELGPLPSSANWIGAGFSALGVPVQMAAGGMTAQSVTEKGQMSFTNRVLHEMDVFFGTANPEAGRQKAIEYTSKFPEGTVGRVVHVAVKEATHILTRITDPTMRNVAGGKIGEFYQSIEDILSQPVTKERIRQVAEKETAWFNEQKGLTGFIGSLMPASIREAILVYTAETLYDTIPEK